jgi:hypothetical protein
MRYSVKVKNIYIQSCLKRNLESGDSRDPQAVNCIDKINNLNNTDKFLHVEDVGRYVDGKFET